MGREEIFEEYMEKILEGLDEGQKEKVLEDVYDAFEESMERSREYTLSDKFVEKYGKVPDEFKGDFGMVKDILDHMIGDLRESMEDKLKGTGSGTKETRKELMDGLEKEIRLTAGEELLREYLDDRLDQLPKTIPEALKKAKARQYMKEFAKEFGVSSDNLEHIMQEYA